MPTTGDQVNSLKYSYQILGAPLSASALSIKKCYLKLVKRWHPDRYPSGSPEYVEATQMSKLINGAFAAVKNAPLRYHVDAFPSAYTETRPVNRSSVVQPSKTSSEILPKTDWLEFWIRFALGAVMGALLSVRLFLVHYDEPGILIAAIGLTLLLGFAAAQSGDHFWHSMFRRWWMWR